MGDGARWSLTLCCPLQVAGALAEAGASLNEIVEKVSAAAKAMGT